MTQILLANFVVSGAGRTFADRVAGHTNQPPMGLAARRLTLAPTYMVVEEVASSI